MSQSYPIVSKSQTSGNHLRCDHYILNANIARYQKQINTGVNHKPYAPPPPPPPLPPIHQQVDAKPRGTTSSKTFAEMVSGHRTPKVAVKPTSNYLDQNNCILTGEVMSAQHIENIPTLLKLDNKFIGSIYYTGGLKMMFKFINPSNADTFLAMTPIGTGGSGLRKGFADNMDCDRLTWVNIFGVPVRFRSDENYSKIVGVFGKVVNTYNNGDTLDISTGHVCVLTKDWSPFDAMLGDHHLFKKSVGSPIDVDDETCSLNSIDSEDKEDEDEAVSTRWGNPKNTDEVPEEGEIVEEPEAGDEEIQSSIATTMVLLIIKKLY
ncbi:unnamed protein product [Lactuca virosa]|uniref:Uncharacterized protein n=1 Tax=Lactuca virosa TaxID=75947 RepID=A0AAU9NBF3_9ASTR|nr:unnamed protein product [Lactuca virosa]CAH1434910.1 unnamed protein product [Lactuca virosa]